MIVGSSSFGKKLARASRGSGKRSNQIEGIRESFGAGRSNRFNSGEGGEVTRDACKRRKKEERTGDMGLKWRWMGNGEGSRRGKKEDKTRRRRRKKSGCLLAGRIGTDKSANYTVTVRGGGGLQQMKGSAGYLQVLSGAVGVSWQPLVRVVVFSGFSVV